MNILLPDNASKFRSISKTMLQIQIEAADEMNRSSLSFAKKVEVERALELNPRRSPAFSSVYTYGGTVKRLSTPVGELND